VVCYDGNDLFWGAGGVWSRSRGAYDVLKNGGFYHQICNMGYGLILNITSSNLVNYYGNAASGLDFVH